MKPFIIRYGKYQGREVQKVVKDDLPYCLWELENTKDDYFREVIAKLPEVIEEIKKLNRELEEIC